MIPCHTAVTDKLRPWPLTVAQAQAAPAVASTGPTACLHPRPISGHPEKAFPQPGAHRHLVVTQADPSLRSGLTVNAAQHQPRTAQLSMVETEAQVPPDETRPESLGAGNWALRLACHRSWCRAGCSSPGCHADVRPQPLRSKPPLALRVSLPGCRTRACSRPARRGLSCLNNHPDQKPGTRKEQRNQ
jgi:hypothetical protein